MFPGPVSRNFIPWQPPAPGPAPGAGPGVGEEAAALVELVEEAERIHRRREHKRRRRRLRAAGRLEPWRRGIGRRP